MILVAAAIVATNLGARGQTTPGQAIDSAHLPAAGIYSMPTSEGHAAWVVRGESFTLDLTGRQLNGSSKNGALQEKNTGIGLLIDGARDVTIKNLSVSGFHQDIVLRNCQNVRILGSDARLSRAIPMSAEGKPVDTALAVRDIAAWRDYGAGIWLEKCKGCRIEKCKATEAQNGIAIVDSSGTTVYDNDCSFNGGWGISLWNSNHNSVTWNHADFCNRSWMGGWGGDAAGMLVVNGSFKNLIVANSFTHCGDGYLSTDRTNGGFNKDTQKFVIQGAPLQNVVAFCDGSWSSNYAFDSTFSKGNVYYKNTADDSKVGFWLGFSSFNMLNGNTISGNKSDGVAIPQGAGNLLFRNTIENDGAAGIHIWSDTGPARVDQPAQGNVLILNRIAECPKAIVEELSVGTQFQSNTIVNAETPAGFQQKGPDFGLVERAGNYAASQDGAAVMDAYAHRPANWKFYSETKGPKGPGAIKADDYGPHRP